MKLLHTEYTLLLYGTNADPPYPCECVMWLYLFILLTFPFPFFIIMMIIIATTETPALVVLISVQDIFYSSGVAYEGR